MVTKAVITADIVNSSLLKASHEQKLKKQLQALLKPYRFEFYRGDSLQVYLEKPEDALMVALSMRALAQRLTSRDTMPVCDVRVSIGIGNVEVLATKPGNSRGEAFTLSGRGMDELGGKSDRRLIIYTSQEVANAGLNVLAVFADWLMKKLTVKQAQVIYELLPGHTQQQAASNLGKSLATINQHAKAAGWEQLGFLLDQYPVLIKNL